MPASNNSLIKSSKKTFSAVKAAVEAVKSAHAATVQKLGGVLALTNAILTAVLSQAAITVSQAAQAVEAILSKVLTIAINFLADFAGLRNVLHKILVKLA